MPKEKGENEEEGAIVEKETVQGNCRVQPIARIVDELCESTPEVPD